MRPFLAMVAIAALSYAASAKALEIGDKVKWDTFSTSILHLNWDGDPFNRPVREFVITDGTDDLYVFHKRKPWSFRFSVRVEDNCAEIISMIEPYVKYEAVPCAH